MVFQSLTKRDKSTLLLIVLACILGLSIAYARVSYTPTPPPGPMVDSDYPGPPAYPKP